MDAESWRKHIDRLRALLTQAVDDVQNPAPPKPAVTRAEIKSLFERELRMRK